MLIKYAPDVDGSILDRLVATFAELRSLADQGQSTNLLKIQHIPKKRSLKTGRLKTFIKKRSLQKRSLKMFCKNAH